MEEAGRVRWQRPREEGARDQVLSSFATAGTGEQTKVKIWVPAEVPRDTRICIEDVNESDMDIHQSKENEKKGKQPGTGTQGPVKKIDGEGTQEPVKKHGQQQAELAQSKWNAQTRTARSSSSLSSPWWTRCTASRRSCGCWKEMCEKSGVTSVEEGHDVESDVADETMSATVKLAKEIDEPDFGEPSAECQFRGLPGESWLHDECVVRAWREAQYRCLEVIWA